MVDYHKELNSLGIFFIQRLVVHDEYLVETKKEFAKIVGDTMVKNIRSAGEILGSKCPLDGKWKDGTSWTIH